MKLNDVGSGLFLAKPLSDNDRKLGLTRYTEKLIANTLFNSLNLTGKFKSKFLLRYVWIFKVISF